MAGRNNDWFWDELRALKSHFSQWGSGRGSGRGSNRHGVRDETQYELWPDTNPDNTSSANRIAESLTGYEAREADGSNNNLANTGWGSANTALLRVSPNAYTDGAGAPRPGVNARDISNTILDQETSTPSSFAASDMFTFFGQFIDHDVDLTPEGHSETIGFSHADGDFGISRSQQIAGTGTDASNPREYPNVITAYVDASNIYGSSEAVTSLLRADGGTSAYLLTSEDGYAPTLGQLMAAYPDLDPANVGGAPLVVGGNNPGLFVAGDVRANENIALTSMHTIWIREHNFQVDQFRELMPEATENQLFKTARVIVEAEYQNIVFHEYLPTLLGADNIPDYQGYDPNVNAGVSIEFSTAAYRLGHSQISSTLARRTETGEETAQGDVNLFQAFFRPDQLLAGGIDALVRGLAVKPGQEIDENIVDDVRNLLFGGTNADPIDLGVFNILRGHDHGVPTLNEVRMAYGLAPLASFAELTSDASVQAQFASVYGTIDAVDLWVGGLAEDNLAGSQLGETFHVIVLDQFMRWRDGDRFYFEERMKDDPELLGLIHNTSFSDIIVRTTGIDYLQDDAFIAHDRIGGSNRSETLHGGDEHDLIIGFGGRDKLYGHDGDDDLYGGRSHDKLFGGRGDDVLHGEDGNDRLYGGDGEDELRGGAGRDILKGGDDDDRLDGQAGHDKVYGGDGDDELHGGLGRDILRGGDGNDVLVGDQGRDTLYGGRDMDIFRLTDLDAVDIIADYQAGETIDITALLDVQDTDGEAGLTQGDVEAAVNYQNGRLYVDQPGNDLVARIFEAGWHVPDTVSVLVDDGAGNQAEFNL